jgi:hypothetical protein
MKEYDMFTRSTTRIAAGIAASCLAGGVAVATLGSSASAQIADVDGPASTPATVTYDELRAATSGTHEGVASMSSPYIPGVPHVPSDVFLTIDPDGGEATFIGPKGSLFNGPADQVESRVDAWWAEQLAAGLTPEEADEKLAQLGR